MIIRSARPNDLDTIVGLLKEAHLPLDGVAQHLEDFLVAQTDGEIIGAIGMEFYGDTGLLRSAVVLSTHRSGGVGTLLYDRLREAAKARGVHRLVLLTTTAEEYFRRKGFSAIDRTTLSGPILTSSEFTGACPTSAVCMELKL